MRHVLTLHRYLCIRQAVLKRHIFSSSILRSVPGPQRTTRIASRLPSPFPVVDTCPEPTCACQPSPEGLDIDRTAPLEGTAAAYAEHILVSTGHSDWASKIEDDEDAWFVRELKSRLTRDGEFSDPFHSVMIATSSIPGAVSVSSGTPSPLSTTSGDGPSDTKARDLAQIPASRPAHPESAAPTPRVSSLNSRPASAFLLPSFKYIPSITQTPQSISSFIRGFVLPQSPSASTGTATSGTTTSSMATTVSKQPSASLSSFLNTRPQTLHHLLRDEAAQSLFMDARDVTELLVLICGHGRRDSRCGVYGPLLVTEFTAKLRRRGVRVLDGVPGTGDGNDGNDDHGGSDDVGGGGGRHAPPLTARVAQVSHVGGHKYAGNVIVYVPPSHDDNALRGTGVWYGRVEPRHVEGIVDETVLGGRVIRELFRGGVGPDRRVLRL